MRNAKGPFLLLPSFILQQHDMWLPLLMLRNLIVLRVATSRGDLELNVMHLYILHWPLLQNHCLCSLSGYFSVNGWNVSGCCLCTETRLSGGCYWCCVWDRLPTSLKSPCLWLFTTLLRRRREKETWEQTGRTGADLD